MGRAGQAGHLSDLFSQVTALGQAKAVASHRTPNLLWGTLPDRPDISATCFRRLRLLARPKRWQATALQICYGARCRTGRTSQRPVFAGYGSWPGQSGGKPPHSKSAMGHVAEQAGHLGDQFSEVTALGQAKAVASHRTPNLLWGAFGARPEQAFQLGRHAGRLVHGRCLSGSAGSRTKGFCAFADGRLQ